MNFSATLTCGLKGKWSPDGNFLASMTKNTILIRDAATMELALSLQMRETGAIRTFNWSPNSQYILCTQANRIIRIWSLFDAEFTCEINAGEAGVSHAQWSPDGSHVLTICSHKLRVSIWPLDDVETGVSYIPLPKFASKHSIGFSHCGSYLGVLERTKSGKDFLGIYAVATGAWERLVHIAVGDHVADVQGFSWSPNDEYVAVFSTMFSYEVAIYSTDGTFLGAYAPENYDGLGVRCVSWSNDSTNLAIGSYDDHMRVLSHLTWKPIFTNKMATDISPNNSKHSKTVVYVEDELEVNEDEFGLSSDDEEEQQQAALLSVSDEMMPVVDDTGLETKRRKLAVLSRYEANTKQAKHKFLKKTGVMGMLRHKMGKAVIEPVVENIQKKAKNLEKYPSKYYVEPLPYSLPKTRVDKSKPTKTIGVSALQYSFDGSFLLSRSERFPKCVWIWETKTNKLCSILAQSAPIKSVKWAPTENKIAVITGNSKLYSWSTDGVTIVDIPSPDFSARTCLWDPRGTALYVLSAHNRFCICYFDDENMEEDELLDNDVSELNIENEKPSSFGLLSPPSSHSKSMLDSSVMDVDAYQLDL